MATSRRRTSAGYARCFKPKDQPAFFDQRVLPAAFAPVQSGSTDMAVPGDPAGGQEVRLDLQGVPGPWFGPFPVSTPDVGATPKPQEDSAADCRSQDPFVQPRRVKLSRGRNGEGWPACIQEAIDFVAIHDPRFPGPAVAW
jgi:hypothetical protein